MKAASEYLTRAEAIKASLQVAGPRRAASISQQLPSAPSTAPSKPPPKKKGAEPPAPPQRPAASSAAGKHDLFDYTGETGGGAKRGLGGGWRQE
jgi:hypothetical protein